jgi:gamma-glutamylcyclotransferase (GGCT)/AIG2-like uncharacterized protein YtfP
VTQSNRSTGGGSPSAAGPRGVSVFAYGTLLFPEVMQRVIGRIPPSQEATLEGFARFRIRGQSFPGIVAESASCTRGLLFAGVRPTELARLDAYEGDLYVRSRVSVALREGGAADALVYVVAAHLRGEVSELSWDPERFAAQGLQAFIEALPSEPT